MNEARYMEVKNAVFLEQVERRGVDLMDLVSRAVALGVETALAWRPETLTEEEVITGAHQRRYEQELEDQLDTVLRYVELRNGWIAVKDTDRQIEFRNLGPVVEAIAETRKIRKGMK